jgi:hypothetical protein
LRFAGAKQQGLSEDLVDAIADGYETSALPAPYKAAIKLTDAIVNDPRPATAELRAALAAVFTPAQTAELALTAALASAFSKASIIWGPPQSIPTTEVPTPTPDPADRYR